MVTPTDPVIFPKTLIVPTADLVADFQSRVGNGGLRRENVEEIMKQIIQVMLNAETDEELLDRLYMLPEFERLLLEPALATPEMTNIVSEIVPHFAIAMRDRLVSYNAIVHGNLPYFLSEFLGTDMVLTHLPY